MKRTNLHFFFAALLLAVTPLAKGQDFSYTLQGGQTLYFNILDDGVAVTRPSDTTLPYYNQLGNLVIPDTVFYNDVSYPVIAVDSSAFSGCNGLSSISIPSSIAFFGQRAFYQVSGMTRTDYRGSLAQWCNINFVNGSSTPTWASGNLYINNTAVTANSFTNDIVIIKPFAFAGFTALSGNLTLPNSLTHIGDGTFYRCSGLTAVNLPNSIRGIGKNSFRECTNITTFALNEGIDSIGSLAFCQCTALQTITIPRSVRYIGNNAFHQCTSLQTAYYNAENSVAGNRIGNLIYPIFGSGCTSLTSIIIGDNVKVIPDYGFSYCRNVTELVIPDSVTIIGKRTFESWDMLLSVTFGKSITSIGDSAFGWCGQLWRLNMNTTTPPQLGIRPFLNISNTLVVNVPCEAVAAYEDDSQWGRYDINGKMMYNIVLSSNNDAYGSVAVTQQATCDNPYASITATPNPGYSFSHWSDGNSDNPRSILLSQDIELTAFFETRSGIENLIDNNDAIIYSKGLVLVVKTAQKEDVEVYDITGRIICRFEVCGETYYSLPSSGTYLVKVGNRHIKKIAVL